MRGLGPLILSVVFPLLSCASHPPREQTPPQPRQHAEDQFQRLTNEESRSTTQQPPTGSSEQAQQSQNPPLPADTAPDAVAPSRSLGFTGQDQEPGYLVAIGRGDLKKGQLVCERVADMVARMELAKQIRVFVKEHAVDRVRERTGEPFHQDVEIVREEMVNELLQDVRIIERRQDAQAGTCSSTAVMPKSRIMPATTKAPETGLLDR